MVRPRHQTSPGKIGGPSFAGYTHGKADQRSTKNQRVWLDFQSAFVPSWCGASKTIKACWKTWDISSPPRAVAPVVTLPRSKVGLKMMNKVTIATSWLISFYHLKSVYGIVCKGCIVERLLLWCNIFLIQNLTPSILKILLLCQKGYQLNSLWRHIRAILWSY